MAHFSCMPVQEVLDQLGTSVTGLGDDEVRRRRDRDGPNRLTEQPPVPAWRILVRQFADFIIYMLLFAILFSLLIGEYGDSLVILVILVMNGCIGFFQELRANRSLEALKNMARIHAVVTREANTATIDAAELVVGDIISLESGDKIPADCRLISAIELQVEESALTGESEPTRKQVAPLRQEVGLSDQATMVFASTAVVAGRGMAVVTGCGMATEIGRISAMIAASEEEKTPLQKRLDRFGRNLGLVIIAICILVFLLLVGRLRQSQASLDSLVFLEFAFIAISLAVAAVPTALPAVVTIALSIGTRRLLAKNMLVRRLSSVETLGSCDVICSDKTGTLTRNRMTVQRVWTLAGELNVDSGDVWTQCRQQPELTKLLTIGATCNNAAAHSATGGNPTERALMVSAEAAGIACTGQRVQELPFDSTRKCMSVVVQEGGGLFLYTKGAPDRLLSLCTEVMMDGRTQPMSDAHQRTIQNAIHHLSGQAMRVMAFAYREARGSDDTEEQNLIFVGLQAMIDPPRHDVADSIRLARKARIRVIMITGDHKETALAIAREIGIEGRALTGQELDGMSDAELDDALPEIAIFARVIPEHKQRIIRALQDSGHVVAMTGDGVNDAPALKKADIGIAVGSGTDVAREASDFVLLDDSFTSIVDAVEQGRGIYENIQKSIMLLLSGNLMEVLIIFTAVLLGFNLPLTALLLLWINLITDGAPALAYSVDPYGAAIMHRPPIPMSEGILPARRLKLLVTLGVLGAAIGLALFHFGGGNTSDPAAVERARTMVFNYVVLYEMVLVFVIRSSYRVKLFTNGWLWAAVLFSILMQGVIMYTPLRTIFHITALDLAAIVRMLAANGLFLALCLLLARLWQTNAPPAATRDR